MTMASPRIGSPTLSALVQEIRAIVRAGGEAGRVAGDVAQALRPYLGRADLLLPSQEEPDPTRYRQHILHVEEDGAFSIVSLVWTRGQETSIHDHVSWCVVGVHRGREDETRYRLDAGRNALIELETVTSDVGAIAALTPPGDIHKVANRSTDLTISIHIYGADIGKLGSSIRRRYDLPVVSRV
ncbi:MAG: cysteine dioxygenase family protein [Chloroflexota bacterium]|nr:cysteine dioxygenase family protein [Dehalococcoidia bacterium]MDW8252868.1 cysteine dioxygenase family protein [Chloroflexota bacterium]